MLSTTRVAGCCWSSLPPCSTQSLHAIPNPAALPCPLQQAERLRAKAQRPEASRSMQQQCRYLYYLGRIRAVQVRLWCGKLCGMGGLLGQGGVSDRMRGCSSCSLRLAVITHPFLLSHCLPHSWSTRRPRTACSRRRARWAVCCCCCSCGMVASSRATWQQPTWQRWHTNNLGLQLSRLHLLCPCQATTA